MSKTHFFFIVFVFISAMLYGQPESSKLLLKFNGGYADHASSNGASYVNSVSSVNTNWNAGLSLGLAVSKHWEIGIGADYQHQKTDVTSELYVYNQWITRQQTETKVHMVIGKVYTAYYLRLFSRLYFNPNLAVGYGKAKGTQESFTVGVMTQFPNGNNNGFELESSGLNFMTNGERDISYDYFAIRLAPAFSFFFNKHIALNLEMGSFQFSTTEWEWSNRQWIASVSPTYWQLGAIIAF